MNSRITSGSYIANSLSMLAAAWSFITGYWAGWAGCTTGYWAGWAGCTTGSLSGSSGSSLSPTLSWIGFYKLDFCLSCCYLSISSLLAATKSGLCLICNEFTSMGAASSIWKLGTGSDLTLISVLCFYMRTSILMESTWWDKTLILRWSAWCCSFDIFSNEDNL